MPLLVRRIIGVVLLILSVYFVLVVAFSGSRVAEGIIEFRAWLLTVFIFGGLAYLTFRYGWRLIRPPKTDEPPE